METRNQILTELQEIAPQLGQQGLSRIPYGVPSGYFADFPDLLMIRIHLESTGYTENAGREISEISPLLSGLRNKVTYQAPEGFFKSLHTKIPAVDNTTPVVPFFNSLSGTKSLRGKKVIPLPMRIIRYAAAACIVGLIGIATFNVTHHRNITDPIMGLTTVSDQEMANYLDADDIHWTPGVTSPAETASVEFSDEDIHDLFKGVPDVELEQYILALPEQKGTVN
jgi:hypothetical protein